MPNCKYVRDTYRVPAEIGRRVIIDGRPGIIAEDRGHYIGVNFDDVKPGVVANAHPTWRIEYGAIGQVRQITRSQRRYLDYLRLECNESFSWFLKNR